MTESTTGPECIAVVAHIFTDGTAVFEIVKKGTALEVAQYIESGPPLTVKQGCLKAKLLAMTTDKFEEMKANAKLPKPVEQSPVHGPESFRPNRRRDLFIKRRKPKR